MSHIVASQLEVTQMANGQAMTVPVYTIKGTGNGPSVYIQANIHGAEVQGNAVIYQLMEQFKQLDCYGKSDS